MANKFKKGQTVEVMFTSGDLKKGDIIKVTNTAKCEAYEENINPPFNFKCCKECGGQQVYLKGVETINNCWGNTKVGFPLKPMNNTLKSLIND